MKKYHHLYYRSHPPMAAMQQWALDHGFYWPGCPGYTEPPMDEEFDEYED